jgi:hypothetical protein
MTDTYYRYRSMNLFYREAGYEIGSPVQRRSKLRVVLALLAIVGMALAAAGLVCSFITLAPWASGTLVIGLVIFSVAGYAARHIGRAHSSRTWRPI